MDPSLSRRSLLRAVGSSSVVLGSGCITSRSDGGAGPSGRTTAESRVDDFYVENFAEYERCVAVTVSTGGEPVLDGSYVLDGGQGARFVDVGHEGETYAVRATLDGYAPREFEWRVDDCSRWGGNRNAAVIVESGELAFRANGCDEIAVGYALDGYLVQPESADCTG